VQTNDGVALVVRGDTVSIVYQEPARLDRSKWVYDRIDDAAASNSDSVMAFLVILPTSHPPDGPTRAENTARLRKLGPTLRRLVTVPIGDALWVNVVRTIMRGMAIVQGNLRVQVVADTIDEGIRSLLEAAGPRTPTRAQMENDLRAMYEALGVAPRFSAPP
jgi:hypothetical protein